MKTLFVGTYGHVRAINAETGHDIWDVSLPGTGYETVVVHASVEHLFAASHGKVFRLDMRDGRILWSNDLKGLGYEHLELALGG